MYQPGKPAKFPPMPSLWLSLPSWLRFVLLVSILGLVMLTPSLSRAESSPSSTSSVPTSPAPTPESSPPNQTWLEWQAHPLPHELPDLSQSPTILDLLRKHCRVSAQVQVTPTPSMTQVPNVEAAFITLRCQ
jgi:hypothetical protein